MNEVVTVLVTAGVPLMTSVVLWFLNRKRHNADLGQVVTSSAAQVVTMLTAENERLRARLHECERELGGGGGGGAPPR